MSRASASAPAVPNVTPTATSASASPAISRSTSPLAAPSATRTPISRVRRDAAYAMTP